MYRNAEIRTLSSGPLTRSAVRRDPQTLPDVDLKSGDCTETIPAAVFAPLIQKLTHDTNAQYAEAAHWHRIMSVV